MGRRLTRTVKGLGVSPGIGIGQAVCIHSRIGDIYRFPLPAERVEAEIERLHEAVRRASEEIDTTRQRAGRELGAELAAIFEAHTLMLDDPAFLGRIEERIRSEKVNAEWAVHKTTEELEARFESLDSAQHKERSEDLLDVAQYLLRWLRGISHHEISEIEGDVVVIADDLTPSEAVRLGRERVVGFAVESGGRTSHTTIIARSLHIPLVAGLRDVTDLVSDEVPVIVDGTAGRVVLNPTPRVLEDYRDRQRRLRELDKRREPVRSLPSVTRDGVEVALQANIDLPEEIDDAIRHGAAGIGLYRSEFLYIEKSPELPSEEEHVALYRQLLERMRPHPVTIRTFDLGGRKLAREVIETHEDNPVLGLRGVRLTLARPDIFKLQIRALLRAGLHGHLRILVPMVASLDEVRQFKAFVAEVAADLERDGQPYCRDYRLGVMIEVPSAALIADALAREVDFFSIGTNDLIQYAMAVDRNNEHVSYLYRPLHPAILRMIRHTAASARQAGIEVSICGEMAADRSCAPLLLGMGVRQLSMSPRSIPLVKTRIRELAAGECEAWSARCLEFATADEVAAFLRERTSRPQETRVSGDSPTR